MRTFVLCLAATLALAACGGPGFQKHAHESLTTALAATDAAKTTFVAWDLEHQKQLVAGAANAEEARSLVDAYRPTQAKILAAFTVAYSAIATAATALAAAQTQKDQVNVAKFIADAVAAVMDAKAAVDAIREVKAPAPTSKADSAPPPSEAASEAAPAPGTSAPEGGL